MRFKGRERFVPQWNGQLDNSFDYCVEWLVRFRVEIIDVGCYSSVSFKLRGCMDEKIKVPT